MKITDIKTFLVGAESRNWVYVKVLTDQGIYGIGEAYSAGPDASLVLMHKPLEDDLFRQSTMTFGEHLEELRVPAFNGLRLVVGGENLDAAVQKWVARFTRSAFSIGGDVGKRAAAPHAEGGHRCIMVPCSSRPLLGTRNRPARPPV